MKSSLNSCQQHVKKRKTRNGKDSGGEEKDTRCWPRVTTERQWGRCVTKTHGTIPNYFRNYFSSSNSANCVLSPFKTSTGYCRGHPYDDEDPSSSSEGFVSLSLPMRQNRSPKHHQSAVPCARISTEVNVRRSLASRRRRRSNDLRFITTAIVTVLSLPILLSCKIYLLTPCAAVSLQANRIMNKPRRSLPQDESTGIPTTGSRSMGDKTVLSITKAIGDYKRSPSSAFTFFSTIDRDGDGKLEPEEVASFLREEIGGTDFDSTYEVETEVIKMMEDLDTNHDHTLDQADVFAYWKKLESLLTADEVAEWVVHAVQLPEYIGRYVPCVDYFYGVLESVAFKVC